VSPARESSTPSGDVWSNARAKVYHRHDAHPAMMRAFRYQDAAHAKEQGLKPCPRCKP
jgi:methylphosphotriester-DNA--protein-cysteine methyltransferase